MNTKFMWDEGDRARVRNSGEVGVVVYHYVKNTRLTYGVEFDGFYLREFDAEDLEAAGEQENQEEEKS